MYGLFGKLLQVDLTNNRVRDKKIKESDVSKYIGGKGLGLKLLLDLCPEEPHEAFSAESPVIFMTGPFTGFGIPGSGRHVVLGKSPLTGYLAESYSGGFFGTELKRTGYDGIIITGKAEIPQYLIISADDIILGNAHSRGLMGKYPAEVEQILRNKYGDIKVSAIGPSGERLVRYACIINDDNRANGRGGLGAVLGFKNLKAIGVSGSQKAEIFDSKRFKLARRKYIDNLRSNTNLDTFGKYGTANLIETLNERGILPTKNFQEGTFSSASDITGKNLYETILTDRDTCSYCTIKCKRVVQGKFNGSELLPLYGGPEYETVAAFGSLLKIGDLNAIALANQKCNQYGLDTISTGNVIAYTMEASEKGLIKEKIKWGDSQAVMKLIDDINKRIQLGKYLGEGVKRFSKKIKGEKFAVHGKGLEIPMHEPRGKKGLGMSYALSPRGGTHLEGLHDTMIEKEDSSPELGAVQTFSRFSLKNKIPVVLNFENTRSFTNCLIQCVFTVTMHGSNYNVNMLRDIYTGITGKKMDAKSMLKFGSIIFDMGREYSYRQGLRSEEDDLPERFKSETLQFGDKRNAFSDAEFKKYRKEYYELRRWNSKGRPTKLKI